MRVFYASSLCHHERTCVQFEYIKHASSINIVLICSSILIMSLSKRSAYLLLHASPSLLKMATITVLAITLAQIFERTEPGKRWKEWLANLSEQPTKLEQWEDDYIMKRLKDHQCYFSDLDFHTESQSSTEEDGSTTSEPSPSNSQEISASCYNIKVSLQRSISLPDIAHTPAKR